MLIKLDVLAKLTFSKKNIKHTGSAILSFRMSRFSAFNPIPFKLNLMEVIQL